MRDSSMSGNAPKSNLRGYAAAGLEASLHNLLTRARLWRVLTHCTWENTSVAISKCGIEGGTVRIERLYAVPGLHGEAVRGRVLVCRGFFSDGVLFSVLSRQNTKVTDTLVTRRERSRWTRPCPTARSSTFRIWPRPRVTCTTARCGPSAGATTTTGTLLHPRAQTWAPLRRISRTGPIHPVPPLT